MSATRDLATAAAAGDVARARKILARHPEATTHWKPLMDASFHGQPELVKLLLSRGADVDVVSGNPYRHRPIHRVVEYKTSIPKGPRHLEVARILCEAGADLELEGGNHRWRPLAAATHGGQRDYVDLLLEFGAKRDIFTASAIYDVARVKSLLARDRKLATARDAQGRTPLHYLCASGLYAEGGDGKGGARRSKRASERAVETATLLLDAGADPDAPQVPPPGEPRFEMSPLYWAVAPNQNARLVAYLFERGADAASVLHDAAVYANEEILELCLAQGCDVDGLRGGRTPLHWLLGHRQPKNADWFLARGANPNLKDRKGRTALHYAAYNGLRGEVLEALVRVGAKLTAKDREGNTPLATARGAGKRNAEKTLQALGARG